jgi:pSer/pThr/pTyr-binding forkhead associated (FHA) protein
MLYLIRFDIQQPDGPSLSELREVWRRGFGILQSFKAMGQRTVFAVADLPNDEALDEALAVLPLVKELGSVVKIEVIPAWPYDEPDAPGVAPTEPTEERAAMADELAGPDASATLEPSPRVFIQTVGRPDDSEALEVDQAGISLGRSSDNRVVLDDPGASYRHALIRHEGDGYRIEDLGSRNGTWVNDKRLTGRHALEDGDEIRVGNTRLVFNVVDEAAQQEPPPARPEVSLTREIQVITDPPEEEPEVGPEETEPERPEEAGQITEAIPSLDVREQTPDEPEEPVAEESAPLEPDREKGSAFVPRGDEEPTTTPAASPEEKAPEYESLSGVGGSDTSEPEPPEDGQEGPARPEESSITGAIRGLDTPKELLPERAPEPGLAEERAAVGKPRPDEADQGPTQIDEEGSITGAIRGLDAPGEAEQPAEGQITGMIRSLDAPGGSPATRVFLRILDGSAAGETFEVGRTRATMGRSPENQILMNDEKLSRRHAGIEFKDGDFWLSDLGSSNGTFVNQNRLHAPHRLRSGDVIKLGGVRLSVTLETAG